MHADFSRVTFRPAKHYSAVLAQQGRIQLDADANEQAAIELHRTRTLTADVIGQHGGPAGASGFAIGHVIGNHEVDDLTIGGGRYYVDGILCDATRPQPGEAVPADGVWQKEQGEPSAPTTWTYWDQPDAYRDPELTQDRLPDRFPYLVYLKVWERAVSAVEDPQIREVALGTAMPDTAARLKTVWQVLPLPAAELNLPDGPAETVRTAFDTWARAQETSSAQLAVRTERPERADEDPCLIHPDARYRGPENQLYRVEVHHGGTAAEGATFKWSRENGSVVFPVCGIDGTWVTLASLGGDDKLSLDPGAWIEIADSAYASRDEPAPLLQVEQVDLPGRRVRLSGEPVPGVGRLADRHPFLRRWDHSAVGSAVGGHGTPRLAGGALQITESSWIELEDGLQVWFKPGGTYRPGDYWTVAARTVTGTVEWPQNAAGEALLLQPEGIRVHHAPLAWMMSDNRVLDLRRVFHPLTAPAQAAQEN
jgi:Family of unknown function (DUF6519)